MPLHLANYDPWWHLSTWPLCCIQRALPVESVIRANVFPIGQAEMETKLMVPCIAGMPKKYKVEVRHNILIKYFKHLF